jgi:DNA (cytosine-5)-methyltransferase 1
LPFQILFEPEGVRRHSPPSRETRERVTGTISSRTTGGGGLGTDFDIGGGLIPEIPEVAWALQERDSKGSDSKGSDSSTKEGHLIPCQIASPLTVNAYADRASEENNLIAHSLRGEGFDASEEGTGRGTPLVAIPIDLRNGLSDGDKNYDVTPFDTTQITSKGNYSRPQPGAPCHPLAEGAHPPAIAYRTSDNCNAVEQGDKTAALNTATDPNQNIICFQPRIARNGRGQPDEIAPALNGTNAGDSSDSRPVIATQWGVRRLQPIECEKLQGFPAGHTEGYSDSARYKMIGNAVAVPVVTWLAIRIKAAIAPQPPA